jgi:hypothetical protein
VEIVVVWSTSTGLWVADRVPAERAGSTPSDSVAVAVLLFPSVTVSVTVKGDPVIDDGVQLIEAELALEHPLGRLDQK